MREHALEISINENICVKFCLFSIKILILSQFVRVRIVYDASSTPRQGEARQCEHESIVGSLASPRFVRAPFGVGILVTS